LGGCPFALPSPGFSRDISGRETPSVQKRGVFCSHFFSTVRRGGPINFCSFRNGSLRPFFFSLFSQPFLRDQTKSFFRFPLPFFSYRVHQPHRVPNNQIPFFHLRGAPTPPLGFFFFGCFFIRGALVVLFFSLFFIAQPLTPVTICLVFECLRIFHYLSRFFCGNFAGRAFQFFFFLFGAGVFFLLGSFTAAFNTRRGYGLVPPSLPFFSR